MSTYQILLIVQIVALLIGFFGLYSLFSSMLRAESKYLLGASLSAVLYGLGYLMEMMAPNVDIAFDALRVQYLGLAYVSFMFANYVVRSAKVIHVPTIVWRLLFFYETVTLVLVLTSRHHHLYYRSLNFTDDGVFPHLEEHPTILLWIFMFHMAALVVFCSIVAIKMIVVTPSAKLKLSYQGVFAATIAVVLVMAVSMLLGFEGYESTSAVVLLLIGVIAIIKTSGRTMDPVEMAYAQSYQRSKAALIVLNEDYCYLDSNPSADEIYPELLKMQGGARFAHVNELTRAVRENKRIEVNGRYYLPYLYTLDDEKNHTLGYVFVLPDVTESENRLHDLAELKKVADEANEAKSIFLANMSHEMRTPLNAIIGLTELAQRENTVEGLKEYLPQILNSGQMLLDIISDVLDFSKAESGKVDIVPVEYDLAELLNTVINIANVRLGEKTVDFIVDVDPTIPHKLVGDDARVRQILVNFLVNAVKYTDKGFIKLTVDWEELGGNILLKIAVSDSGRGIKQEDIGKLFSVFSRLDMKNNRNIQGSGLGLAIAGQLIKLMKGTYRVESEYGKGSTFSCIFPQKVADPAPLSTQKREELHLQQNMPFILYGTQEDALEQAKTAEKSEENAVNLLSGLRVLIVDDNRVNIKVLAAMLKVFEIAPDSTLSGAEAIEKVKASQYDVILMDHMMPEMDGIEAAQKIRELDVPWAKETVIIACTANAVKGAETMFLENGMNDYLCKPVKMSEMQAMLEKWVREDA